MLETDFFILTARRTPSSCLLDTDVGDPPLSPPAEGDPVQSEWPKSVGFRMSDSDPGLVVPDFINNAFRFLMVSPRAKAHLEKSLQQPTEYLQFAVIDHKGRKLKEPHFVVNIVGRLDCADAKTSKGDPDSMNPGWFDYYEELHLDVKKIPAGTRIFRLGTRPCLILVHRSLKDELETEKFTGAGFVPMGGPEE
jgi:uncharacterized protein DUF1629